MERRRIAHHTRWLALALIAVTGCAGIDDALGPRPPVVTGDGGVTEPNTCTLEGVTPPPLLLSTSAGDQIGQQLSFCSNNQELGCGICADAAEIPVKRFTIAHKGDSLTLGMPKGTLITPGPDRCQPACPPQIAIMSLCSHELIDQRAITEDEAFMVDLTPGLYELVADASFEADPLTGSTGSSFGLVIDDSLERGIVDDKYRFTGNTIKQARKKGGEFIGRFVCRDQQGDI